MSPEAIQTPDLVDTRSDLYAVGAVGYFLLTGQSAFNASTMVELCQMHMTAIPEAPSMRLGRPVDEGLEHALLSCLEKDRSKRPQTAWDLAEMLEGAAANWSFSEAKAWWSRHERIQRSGSPNSFDRNSDGRSDEARKAPSTETVKTVIPAFDHTIILQSHQTMPCEKDKDDSD